MSRIISGKVRLDVQQVDLVQVIHAAIESVKPAAQGKEIDLRQVLDPRAGPVSGDPTRLPVALGLVWAAPCSSPQHDSASGGRRSRISWPASRARWIDVTISR